MSREGVVKLITRALEDEKFRAEIKANPDAALAQFDLSADEIAAIKTGDTSRLGDVAIDERVSKLSAPTVVPQAFIPTTVQSAVPTTAAPASASNESLIAWLVTLFSKTQYPNP
jgi:hypothetical protein